MKSPLNILHLEDDPLDALLVQSALEAAGIAFATTWVHTRLDFVAALESGGIDLVLSDFSLPSFDGLAAAELVRTRWPEIPLILVSGTLGEELAVDSLKTGATDYVLKDRLARLGPAVRRAMLEVEAKAENTRLGGSLIEAQKMEVLGQLAGGVAHDFNNLLAVIMGYNDLLAAELSPASPLRNYSEEIRHASERACGLTRQLLVFSRNQTVQPTVLSLNEVVQDVDHLMRRLIDASIEIVIVPESDLGLIRADAGYVGQVLMNLAVNARDAMPEGGQMTVATGNCTHDPGSAHPGEFVKVSVRDTGCGMSHEVRARVFEPFFTTKPEGKGTGLGLAICQNIVAQSGGDIVVDSEVGRGTTVTVYFPRVHESPAVVPPAGRAEGSPRGTETVLVVEDEPSVRLLASRILTAHGYSVLSAANGREGLQVARDHRGPALSLVVTDVIMPLMGGQVMAEWLKVTYPELKILFTSGYTEDAIAHHGVLDPGLEFLPKPYTPATLLGRVRALLDGPPA